MFATLKFPLSVAWYVLLLGSLIAFSLNGNTFAQGVLVALTTFCVLVITVIAGVTIANRLFGGK